MSAISYIPNPQINYPTSLTGVAGNYFATAQADEGYGITSAKYNYGDTPSQSQLDFPSGNPNQLYNPYENTFFNDGKYRNIRTGYVTTSSVNTVANIIVFSEILSWSVIYDPNFPAGSSDTPPSNRYTYTDNGDARGSSIIDRSDKQHSSGGSTYVHQYHDTVYYYDNSAQIGNNLGWTEPTGWNFVGWNTAANGQGVSYTEGDTLHNVSSDITLYAQWTQEPTYTVNVWFDSDEISGTNVTISPVG